MEKNKKEFIISCWEGIRGNIIINIINGELSYITNENDSKETTHNLEENYTNWESAELLLEVICEYNKEEFIKIARELNKQSQGYKVIKKVIQKQIDNKKSQISKLIEEIKLWNELIS